jgi:hypothetical protein
MIVVAVTGIGSLILFVIAVTLVVRSSGSPPPVIRTHSRRSPAEYAHHSHQVATRRTGYMCAMAGVMIFALFVTMGFLEAVTNN